MSPATDRHHHRAIDLERIQVHPLPSRDSLSRIDDILVNPDGAPPAAPSALAEANIRAAAMAIRAARARGASVMLIFGAHLLKNGAHALVSRAIERGWVTHLATNGAGTIHDWEFAHLGRSTESVRANVTTGTFGTWLETGQAINLAVLTGGLHRDGWGSALGRVVDEDGIDLPDAHELERAIVAEPRSPLTAARADMLDMMLRHRLSGRIRFEHPWRESCVLWQAYRHRVPLTVHPGIGYDIITNHPLFSGSAIGRAAEVDFCRFGAAVDGLDGGVVLSIGSAIMAPQVFEKSMSCVNNLRLRDGRPIVRDLNIHVVDLQDGGNWDWSAGEPPRDNAAYYLRFCKSFARMGGTMRYSQCDNVVFLHRLCALLRDGDAVR